MVIISIISIAIYIMAIIMISTNIYEFEKEKKAQFIVIGIIIIIIFTWIIVILSSMGLRVENKAYIKIAKTSSVLIFAPINTILALPYLGNTMNKLKQKRLISGQVKKRVLILIGVLVIIDIIEVNYIKSFELGMLSHTIK